MKTCNKCNKSQELTNFHKDKSRADGYHIYCKQCRKEQMKEHYHFKNPRKESKCIDCGIDITHLHTQRIRCEGCNEIKERKRKRSDYLSKRDNLEFKSRNKALGKKWRESNPTRYRDLMKKNNDKRKELQKVTH